MFKFKILSFPILIICLLFSSIGAQNEEYNKIIIEGGERSLMQIINDFSAIKKLMSDLKENYEVNENFNNSKLNDLPYFDERIEELPKNCQKSYMPRDCASAMECTKRSGIYKIQVEKYSNDPFFVACDAETDKGDWLVIQKRQDGSVDFYRNWLDYENGFGDIEGEFFIGLKKLHALTNFNGPQELLIVMEDANVTEAAYAKYEAFAIGNEKEAYKLNRIGKYSGTAGNSLQRHIGMKFSTKDRDNDTNPKGNCAVDCIGAWWYIYCHNSNLNGKYGETTYAKGVNWKSFRGHGVSLTFVKMMIRRSKHI